MLVFFIRDRAGLVQVPLVSLLELLFYGVARPIANVLDQMFKVDLHVYIRFTSVYPGAECKCSFTHTGKNYARSQVTSDAFLIISFRVNSKVFGGILVSWDRLAGGTVCAISINIQIHIYIYLLGIYRIRMDTYHRLV